MSPIASGLGQEIAMGAQALAAPGQFALITRPRFRRFFGVVHHFLPLVSGARGVEDDQTIDGQADFHIYKRAATAASFEAKVLYLTGTGRLLQDTPHYLGADGTGQFPMVMPPHGQIIPRANVFKAAAWDRQTVQGAQNIRILHIGEKVFRHAIAAAKAYTKIQSYQYTANFTADEGGNGPIAANGILPFGVRISGDADFDIYGFSILCDDPRLTVQIDVSGHNEEWFSRSCHGLLLGATSFGAAIQSGGTPFRLPHPVRVNASGTINVTCADLSAATNRVQVVFYGLWCEPGLGLEYNIAPEERLVIAA